MGTTSHSGMEVLSETGLQVVPQPEAGPYYSRAEESRRWSPDQDMEPEVATRPYTDEYNDRADEARQISSDQPSPRRGLWERKRGSLACLAIVAVLCMAVGLGVGLGAGLAMRRKSNSSR